MTSSPCEVSLSFIARWVYSCRFTENPAIHIILQRPVRCMNPRPRICVIIYPMTTGMSGKLILDVSGLLKQNDSGITIHQISHCKIITIKLTVISFFCLLLTPPCISVYNVYDSRNFIFAACNLLNTDMEVPQNEQRNG